MAEHLNVDWLHLVLNCHMWPGSEGGGLLLTARSDLEGILARPLFSSVCMRCQTVLDLHGTNPGTRSPLLLFPLSVLGLIFSVFIWPCQSCLSPTHEQRIKHWSKNLRKRTVWLATQTAPYKMLHALVCKGRVTSMVFRGPPLNIFLSLVISLRTGNSIIEDS